VVVVARVVEVVVVGAVVVGVVVVVDVTPVVEDDVSVGLHAAIATRSKSQMRVRRFIT
jgi:hypothetical protein